VTLFNHIITIYG